MKELSAAGESWRRRMAWLVGCLTVSALAGSMTAKGAGVASCPEGEFLQMVDPIVSVIEGPGDLMDEQFRWSFSRFAYLEGPLTIAIGDTAFELERVP